MTLQIARFPTTGDRVAEVDAALIDLVAALAEADPPGVRYAAIRSADGSSYFLLLALDHGVENPLPAIPAARAVQQAMAGWAGGPVVPEPVTVVAGHRMLGSPS